MRDVMRRMNVPENGEKMAKSCRPVGNARIAQEPGERGAKHGPYQKDHDKLNEPALLDPFHEFARKDIIVGSGHSLTPTNRPEHSQLQADEEDYDQQRTA